MVWCGSNADRVRELLEKLITSHSDFLLLCVYKQSAIKLVCLSLHEHSDLRGCYIKTFCCKKIEPTTFFCKLAVLESDETMENPALK